MKTEFVDMEIPPHTGSEWEHIIVKARTLQGSKVMKVTFDDHQENDRNKDEARRMVGCVKNLLRSRKMADILIRQRGCVVYFRKVQ